VKLVATVEKKKKEEKKVANVEKKMVETCIRGFIEESGLNEK